MYKASSVTEETLTVDRIVSCPALRMEQSCGVERGLGGIQALEMQQNSNPVLVWEMEKVTP